MASIFFHLYIASTLNDIYICRNLDTCPWICSFNTHGQFTLVVRELASPKEHKSFMCFIFWHSTCYLNLFLNVLNMRTNLPLGIVTMSRFLGVFKQGLQRSTPFHQAVEEMVPKESSMIFTSPGASRLHK